MVEVQVAFDLGPTYDTSGTPAQMNNSQYITRLLDQLSLELGQQIHDGKLVFTQDKTPYFKNLILDQGYEDPISVRLSKTLPQFNFLINDFGMDDPSMEPEQVAKNIGNFIIDILDSKYTLALREVFGLKVYSITTQHGHYEANVGGGTNNVLSRLFVRVFGTNKRID